MIESKQITKRFREIFLDGNWVVSTNLYTQISTISWNDVKKQYPNIKSIEEIAYHIHYYIKGILDVLEGGTLSIKDKYSSDFTLSNSELEWKNFVNKYKQDCERFSEILDTMNDVDFQKDFFNHQYGTYLLNINALIEHGYYHLGQIILIKKMMGI